MTPTVKLLTYTQLAPAFAEELGTDDETAIIEYSGRWDYGEKSLAKMGDRGIIRRWIDSGEESMVEMIDVTFLVTCSRVVSHELVRHRIASFQQESQRYVKYENEDPEELFFLPPEVEAAGPDAVEMFWDTVQSSLVHYSALKGEGLKSQIARYVLPNAMRTRIVVKMNLREWRHVLKLRLHKSAQPEMREVAGLIKKELDALFPDIFSDIDGEDRAAR